MRRFARLAAAAAFTLVASEAQAADLCWTQPVTSLTVCSGYAISGGGTTWNLDVWAFGTLQPIRITDVGLFNTGATTGTLVSVRGINVLDQNGDLFNSIDLSDAWENGYGNNLLNTSPKIGASSNPQTDGIVGDNTPLSFGGVRTTGTDGSSYVRFTFTTTGVVNTQTAAFGYFAQGDGVSLRCFTDRTVSGYDCDDNPSITSVVPEPSTYALVASGLLGIFGVTRRRRNRAA